MKQLIAARGYKHSWLLIPLSQLLKQDPPDTVNNGPGLARKLRWLRDQIQVWALGWAGSCFRYSCYKELAEERLHLKTLVKFDSTECG